MSTKKTELKIRTYPDPILRKRVKSVKRVTKQERELLSKMAQCMYEDNGVGLAANQVGISRALLVADVGGCLYKLINPKITKKDGLTVLEEGCLSVPGVSIEIKRAGLITIRALDEDGKPIVIQAEGLLSHVFQHEIDHLRGKLIIDYAPFLKRLVLRRRLRRLKKKEKK